MVPPTLFISGGVAILQLCNEVYVRFKHVRRFREDCRKLAYFVSRIEALITETEDETDMTAPGWEETFSALNESLKEVLQVFDDCAKYGLLRSLINADELNLRWSSIAQRLILALQLIPIQKAKATTQRLAELKELQCEIRAASFVAVRAAEEQSAALKKLMDQSRVDSTKTQEMLAQVLLLLQSDPATRALHSADGEDLDDADTVLRVDLAQLEAEVADLRAERANLARDKKAAEEEYLEQVITAITAMEAALQQEEQLPVPPADLLCPITYQLLHDAVILVDTGQTYERAAIQEWFDRGNLKDPVSGVQLESRMLVPNVLARKLVQDWVKAHPDYRQADDRAVGPELSCQVSSKGSQSDSSAAAAVAAAAVVKAHKVRVEDNRSSASEGAGMSAAAATNDDDSLSLQAKAAAILEAGSRLDPEQRRLAQQAYAAVVAAAAAAEQQTSHAQVAAASSGPASEAQVRCSAVQDTDSSRNRQAAAAPAVAACDMLCSSSMTTTRNACMMQDSPYPPMQGSAPAIHAGWEASSERSCSSYRASTEGDFRVHTPAAAAAELRLLQPAGWEASSERSCSSYRASTEGDFRVYTPAAAAAGPRRLQPAAQEQGSLMCAQPWQQADAHYAAAGLPPDPASSSLYEGGGEAAATAAAWQKQQQQQQTHSRPPTQQQQPTQQQRSCSLDRLRSTFSKAADIRHRMTVRDRPQDAAADSMLVMQGQQRQQQRQQQQDTAYLQRHVQHLLSSQPSHASSSGPSVVQQRYQHHNGQTDLGMHTAHSTGWTGSAGEQQEEISVSSSTGRHRASSDSYLGPVGGGADAAAAHPAPVRTSIESSSKLPPRQQQQQQQDELSDQMVRQLQLPSPLPPAEMHRSFTASSMGSASSGCSKPSQKNGWSVGFGLGRQGRAGSQTSEAASQGEDAGSVCSTTSGESKRSVGKSMMGLLKKVQYTMVYDKEHC